MLLQIAESCHSFADLSRLTRTNKWFCRVLNPWLYKLDVRSGSPCALFWACQSGSLDTLKLVHKAGAALDQTWTSKQPIQRLPPNPYRHSPEFYQKVALGLKDPEDDQTDEETNNGWPETPFMGIEGFINGWTQMELDNDQQREDPLEQEAEEDEESDTAWVIDEGPWEEPYQPQHLDEHHTTEEDHFWLEDTDEVGQPLLKTASQDSRYTWCNEFFERHCGMLNDSAPGMRLFPVFWWHPIDLAVYFGRKEIIQYLVENGVSIQHANSRGLCRQKDISFASSYQGCLRGTYPIFIQPNADWRYSIHHAFGLVACKEDWDMGNFLLDVTGMRTAEKRLVGIEDELVVDFENTQDRDRFFTEIINRLIAFPDGTTVSLPVFW